LLYDLFNAKVSPYCVYVFTVPASLIFCPIVFWADGNLEKHSAKIPIIHAYNRGI